MPPLSPRAVRLSALCGVAAPLLFVVTVIITGYLTPGYDHCSQMMSELGAAGAPLAPVMNLAGLAGTGILLVLFSPGLRQGLGMTRAATAGSILVAVNGILYIVMAAFPCDPGCLPVTPAGEIHLLAGLLATGVAALAAFVLALAQRGRPGWGGFWQYSLATAALVPVAMALFSLAPPGTAGLFQRVLVGIILLWAEVTALRLWLLAGKGP